MTENDCVDKCLLTINYISKVSFIDNSEPKIKGFFGNILSTLYMYEAIKSVAVKACLSNKRLSKITLDTDKFKVVQKLYSHMLQQVRSVIDVVSV